MMIWQLLDSEHIRLLDHETGCMDGADLVSWSILYCRDSSSLRSLWLRLCSFLHKKSHFYVVSSSLVFCCSFAMTPSMWLLCINHLILGKSRTTSRRLSLVFSLRVSCHSIVESPHFQQSSVRFEVGNFCIKHFYSHELLACSSVHLYQTLIMK